MNEVFCFVAVKPCGCMAEACMPNRLRESMRTKWFRDQMDAGKVRSVPTREEFNAIPLTCVKCEPAPSLTQ